MRKVSAYAQSGIDQGLDTNPGYNSCVYITLYKTIFASSSHHPLYPSHMYHLWLYTQGVRFPLKLWVGVKVNSRTTTKAAAKRVHVYSPPLAQFTPLVCMRCCVSTWDNRHGLCRPRIGSHQGGWFASLTCRRDYRCVHVSLIILKPIFKGASIFEIMVTFI